VDFIGKLANPNDPLETFTTVIPDEETNTLSAEMLNRYLNDIDNALGEASRRGKFDPIEDDGFTNNTSDVTSEETALIVLIWSSDFDMSTVVPSDLMHSIHNHGYLPQSASGLVKMTAREAMVGIRWLQHNVERMPLYRKLLDFLIKQ